MKKEQNCDNSIVYYSVLYIVTLNHCVSSKLMSKYSLENSFNVSCTIYICLYGHIYC